MITILLGIALSLYVSLCKWLDKRLQGTTLRGRAAFIITFLVALILAIGKVLLFDRYRGFRETAIAIASTVSAIFGASQIYYHLLVKWLRPTSSTDPLL